VVLAKPVALTRLRILKWKQWKRPRATYLWPSFANATLPSAIVGDGIVLVRVLGGEGEDVEYSVEVWRLAKNSGVWTNFGRLGRNLQTNHLNDRPFLSTSLHLPTLALHDH
jgi:hypothetical protein